MTVYWQMEAPNQIVSGLGGTWTGVTGEQPSLELEALHLMTVTDFVAGIPLGGNRRVWGLVDES